MRPVRFSNPKELSFLQEMVGNIFRQWSSTWASLSDVPVGLPRGKQIDDIDAQPQWLSCRIGRGRVFIALSESYLAELATFILGADISEPERQMVLIERLLLSAYQEFLSELSRELYPSEVIDFCQDKEPVLDISGLKTGGYHFENRLLNLVIESSVLEVSPVAEYHSGSRKELVSRKESLRNIKVTVEAYLPASRLNLSDILKMKKGSVLITDSKIGSELNIKINEQPVHEGRLGKSQEYTALKIIK
ncbi:FliM/FliN family flagellar motor switch protein [Vibrio sp. MEBiC08052]|uniref:FliM/FliN family flagellar motor switch protein n=1 Tax=Vibrio sp. MEBiC08052 TaxID=1761910 RepID=UPI0007406C72|nr:flagellar motor switch protein FliM [Vibrio sp. MEBiC08052]KUI97012.1 hypothetical protein VRK_38670 [Vibrio sp. MEBiC08052]